MAAAVIFKMLFGISFIHHLILMVGRRTWFLIPFLIGALCKYACLIGEAQFSKTDRNICVVETIGYIGRAMSSAQAPDFTENPYIIQSVLLLLGPTLLAASIYMMLGRLIRLLEADDYSLVKPTLMTKVFVTGDVLSFFTQSGGKLPISSKYNNIMHRKLILCMRLRWGYDGIRKELIRCDARRENYPRWLVHSNPFLRLFHGCHRHFPQTT